MCVCDFADVAERSRCSQHYRLTEGHARLLQFNYIINVVHWLICGVQNRTRLGWFVVGLNVVKERVAKWLG